MLIFIALLFGVFVYIESTDIGRGLLTEPLLIAFILSFFVDNPQPFLLSAVIVQLYYLDAIPSGAVRHPEYPHGYYAAATSILLFAPNFVSYNPALTAFLIFAVTIIFSHLGGIFVAYKRRVVGYLADKNNELKENFEHLFYKSLVVTLAFATFVTVLYLFIMYLISKVVVVSDRTFSKEIIALLFAVIIAIFIKHIHNKKRIIFKLLGVVIGLLWVLL